MNPTENQGWTNNVAMNGPHIYLKLYMKMTEEYRSTAGQGQFHSHSKVCVMLIAEDSPVTEM